MPQLTFAGARVRPAETAGTAGTVSQIRTRTPQTTRVRSWGPTEEVTHARDARLRPRRRLPGQGADAVPVRLRRTRGGGAPGRRVPAPGRHRARVAADRIGRGLHGRRVLPP